MCSVSGLVVMLNDINMVTIATVHMTDSVNGVVPMSCLSTIDRSEIGRRSDRARVACVCVCVCAFYGGAAN
jgi:hypothetical protein